MKHENAQQYRTASAHQTTWGMALVRSLALTGEEHVLDLGCGDGRVTDAIAAEVPFGSVIGVDISPAQIAAANKRVRENCTFRCMDLKSISWVGSFDIIVSNASLHWVDGHEELLSRVYRALRPGGRVFLNFAAEGNSANFIEAVKEAMRDPAYAPYFSDFRWPWYMPSRDEYAPIAARVPFSDITVASEDAEAAFPNANAIESWIDMPSIIPFVHRVPPDRRVYFRNDVARGVLMRTRQNDGRYRERFRRIAVYARK